MTASSFPCRTASLLLLCAFGAAAAGCSSSNASLPSSNPKLPSARAAQTADHKPKKGFSVLFSFAGGVDGGAPFGGVIVDGNGNIFGTTFVGGTTGAGAVYELSQSGSTYAETVVHSFTNTDGSNPEASPWEDANGNLYVTALGGGQYGGGTAIGLSPGQGGYSESGVYSFGNTGDGSVPEGTILGQGATLYTTTASGGKYGGGTIVELTPPSMSEKDVYDFGNGSDGAHPLAGLVADASGALYGTTVAGGSAKQGTVFKFVPSGNGGTETVLWSFQSASKSDGASPNSGVALDAAGNIYGTTTSGGATSDGTVFKLTKAHGNYTESILHAFEGAADGADPIGSVTLKGKLLYGTTSAGSGSTCFSCGTLFRIATNGKAYEILQVFQGSNGSNPLATLYATDTALYGTTSNGGPNSLGVVFQFVP